jgi:outer membrane lipoprotein SlyB
MATSPSQNDTGRPEPMGVGLMLGGAAGLVLGGIVGGAMAATIGGVLGAMLGQFIEHLEMRRKDIQGGL